MSRSNMMWPLIQPTPEHPGLPDGFWAAVDFIQNSIVKSVAPRSAALFTSTGTMTRSLPGR